MGNIPTRTLLARASQAYHTVEGHSIDEEYWASLLVPLWWRMTKNLWQSYSPCRKVASIIMYQIYYQVRKRYASFKKENSCLLPHHHCLFLQWSLAQCLQASYNYITCWLCPVEEAKTKFSGGVFMENLWTILPVLQDPFQGLCTKNSFYSGPA